jgi:hypothetical protein
MALRSGMKGRVMAQVWRAAGVPLQAPAAPVAAALRDRHGQACDAAEVHGDLEPG